MKARAGRGVYAASRRCRSGGGTVTSGYNIRTNNQRTRKEGKNHGFWRFSYEIVYGRGLPSTSGVDATSCFAFAETAGRFRNVSKRNRIRQGLPKGQGDRVPYAGLELNDTASSRDTVGKGGQGDFTGGHDQNVYGGDQSKRFGEDQTEGANDEKGLS